MAAAFDGEATQTIVLSGGSTYNITNKTTAGFNRMGVVAVGGTQFAGPPYVTGITWSGVAMTVVGEVQASGQVASLWVIKDPPTGASTIAVTPAYILGAAVAASYNGVDTSGAAPYIRIGSLATAIGSSSVISNTPGASASGDIVIDAVGPYNTEPTTTGTNTRRGVDNNSGVYYAALSDASGNSTPPAMTWISELFWASVTASWAATGVAPTIWGPLLALQNNRLVQG